MTITLAPVRKTLARWLAWVIGLVGDVVGAVALALFVAVVLL